MKLFHSQAESKVLGLKIGRGQGFFERIDLPQLTQEILEGQYDICRIKVNIKDVSLFQSLNALQMPYDIYTINYHNLKHISHYPKPELGSVHCELYDGSQRERLLTMLNAIERTRSWPAFESPYMRHFISPEQDQSLFIQYFSSFNYKERPQTRCWFLKDGDTYVGVFMGSIEGEVFNGALYGILPEYRGRGYSKMIYQYMFYYCTQLGTKAFINDVHLLNLASQRSAVSSKLLPKDIYVNVVLFSLLSYSSLPIQTGSHEGEIRAIFDKVDQHLTNEVTYNSKIIRVLDEHEHPPYQYTLSYPIYTPTLKLIVLKIQNTQDQYAGYAYWKAL